MTDTLTTNRQIEGAVKFIGMQKLMGRETVCGSGSTLENTCAIREWLPRVMARHDIRWLHDVPCGDRHWIRSVPIEHYSGTDLLDGVDLLGDYNMPDAKLILCRDFLVHLTFGDAKRFLDKCARARFLILTHFPDVTENPELVETHPGWGWRPLNMCLPPFNLPEPIDVCEEDEGQGKTLSLFKLSPST